MFSFDALRHRVQWHGGKALLSGLAPLGYARPPSPEEDIPGFVRAASGIRRWRDTHLVVQDDVNALALVDPEAPGRSRPLLLARGHLGRRRFEDALGNKAHKLDLEAVATLPDGRALVLGSGSRRGRETVVLLDTEERPTVVDAAALYREFAQAAFAGSELNVEGAVVLGDSLLVLQRGNGASVDGLRPVNAIGELGLAELLGYLDAGGPAPKFRRVIQVDLGALDGATLGFTDVAVTSDHKLAFLACAEASPDTYRDGVVLGNCFGWFDDSGGWLVPVVDGTGEPSRLKLEGLEARPGADQTYYVVVDADDATLPASIGVLELEVTE